MAEAQHTIRRPAILPFFTEDGGVAYAIEPDPSRDVQVATAIDHEPREPIPGIVPDRDVFCLRPRGAVFAVVMMCSVAAGLVIAWLTPIPAWLAILASLLLMGGWAIFSPSLSSTGEMLWERRGAKGESIPEDAQLNSAFRVRLRVAPGKAGEVGPITDGPFEPQVSHAAFAIHNPVGVYMWLFTALLVGIAWGMWWMLGRGYLPRLPVVTYQVYGLIALMIAVAPFYVLFPTYYRVSPGLLEVLRYRPLLAGKPRIKRIDLRRVRVLVDLVNARLEIEEPITDARTGVARVRTSRFDMGPAWAMDRVEFAQHVLQATRWRGDLGNTSQEGLSG
jgi:hypothetical protein